MSVALYRDTLAKADPVSPDSEINCCTADDGECLIEMNLQGGGQFDAKPFETEE